MTMLPLHTKIPSHLRALFEGSALLRYSTPDGTALAGPRLFLRTTLPEAAIAALLGVPDMVEAEVTATEVVIPATGSRFALPLWMSQDADTWRQANAATSAATPSVPDATPAPTAHEPAAVPEGDVAALLSHLDVVAPWWRNALELKRTEPDVAPPSEQTTEGAEGGGDQT